MSKKQNSVQKQIWQNKLDKGFNTENVDKEFCFAYGELGEAYNAYRKGLEDLGDELADVAIYLYALSEMLGFDLDNEVTKKLAKNKARKYEKKNGVLLKI